MLHPAVTLPPSQPGQLRACSIEQAFLRSLIHILASSLISLFNLPELSQQGTVRKTGIEETFDAHTEADFNSLVSNPAIPQSLLISFL